MKNIIISLVVLAAGTVLGGVVGVWISRTTAESGDSMSEVAGEMARRQDFLFYGAGAGILVSLAALFGVFLILKARKPKSAKT